MFLGLRALPEDTSLPRSQYHLGEERATFSLLKAPLIRSGVLDITYGRV